eukprot:m.28639 g.28639  ORF g.28639 m.28639 type:complete len:56 (+) comp6578_c0_seq1:391-558(+)
MEGTATRQKDGNDEKAMGGSGWKARRGNERAAKECWKYVDGSSPAGVQERTPEES